MLLTNVELLLWEEDTKELVFDMINNHICRIANNDNIIEPIDYTISSTQTILPENIFKHYHPERIKDSQDLQKRY